MSVDRRNVNNTAYERPAKMSAYPLTTQQQKGAINLPFHERGLPLQDRWEEVSLEPEEERERERERETER